MQDLLKSDSERISELRKLLNKANHAYYVLDEPFLEDVIFDRLYRELIELERKYPSLVRIDSPTQRLGGKPSLSFKSIKHKIPLLSLDNAFDFKELANWQERIYKLLQENFSLICELKIDGNALALSYINGTLQNAATRGDGNKGEEITANARTISSIPLSLHLEDPPEWLEVRGEAFIPNQTFQKLNSERKKKDEQLFANPRNACSGTLRQLDSQIVSSRHLDFFAYTIYLPEDWHPNGNDPKKPNGQWEALQWLKHAGFKVNPNAKCFNHLEEVKEFCQYWEVHRKELPYATDGVVVKTDRFDLQEIAGSTQKAPRWAIALKFPAEESPTELKKLNFQIGRTGAVTPVAEFKPIVLAGTVVSRATLHNSNRLEELNLHSGDTIVVRKAGEIIPEVVRVIKELRPQNTKKLFLPKTCPECSSELVKESNAAATRCINTSCPAILRGALRHWVSKGAMDIEGVGSKLIEQLVKKELICSIADLYKIKIKSLAQLERMGEKSALKILTAIENSKKNPWNNQLYGLGILHIGENNAKAISKVVPSVQALASTIDKEPEKLSAINGIGKEIIDSLRKWFSDENNKILINQLTEVGITLEEKLVLTNNINKKLNNNKLENKIIVITGTLPSLSRQEVKAIIENAGGKINSSISSKTNYLLAGEKTGSKLRKAKEIGIKIINERELMNLIQKKS